MLQRSLMGLALAGAIASGAAAQDLPKNQFKVIGLNSPTPVSIYDEVPFWRKTIPEASKGAITADITPLDQMGIDDKTMLRLLKLGVMDFAGMDISKMAGDDPRFEACDLAGLTLDPDKARAACDAYRGVIDRQMQKNWGAKLLAFGGNTPQVFWCRDVGQRPRRLQGQEDPRVQQHDARLPRRRRRRPRSAWPSPRSCRRSTTASSIAA